MREAGENPVLLGRLEVFFPGFCGEKYIFARFPSKQSSGGKRDAVQKNGLMTGSTPAPELLVRPMRAVASYSPEKAMNQKIARVGLKIDRKNPKAYLLRFLCLFCRSMQIEPCILVSRKAPNIAALVEQRANSESVRRTRLRALNLSLKLALGWRGRGCRGERYI